MYVCGNLAHHCMCSAPVVDITLTKVLFRKYYISYGTTETLWVLYFKYYLLHYKRVQMIRTQSRSKECLFEIQI
jgi:hypothetical protein